MPGKKCRVINRANRGGGFAMPAIHIYKAWSAKIHEIDAMGVVEHYIPKTGSEK